MLKFLSIVCLSLFIVNLTISLIIGHIQNYYNPSIKSTYTGFCSSLIGISFCILLLTARHVQYGRNVLLGTAIVILVVSMLVTVF